MPDHQGLPVAGYKPQPQRNVERVNYNKRLEECVLRVMDDLQASDADPRWLAIARTQIEQGFMALNRAIFKPGRVELPTDETVPR